MTLTTKAAPYARNKKTTFQIMIELTIALGLVFIFSVVYSFIKLGAEYGIRAILLMLVGVACSLCSDVIFTFFTNKKDKELLKKMLHNVTHNYSWVTGMILVLCCPVWTRYYAIIAGSFFATLIVKNLFGGFGKNIFNPAAMGRIFIALCFSLSAPESVTAGVDATTGATLTGIINSQTGWLLDSTIEQFSLVDMLFGNYFGAMGETCTVLLVVCAVLLILRKDMNWRPTVFYIGTVAVSSLVIGLVLGMRNPFIYMLYHLLAGGLVFGAVFMLTDPVTTPTSPVGKVFVGIIAGLLTMIFRIATNMPEGVVYSIAIVNLITPAIDHLVVARSQEHLVRKYCVTCGTLVLSIAITSVLGLHLNGGQIVYEVNGINKEEYEEVYFLLDQGGQLSSKNYDIKAPTKEVSDPALVTKAQDDLLGNHYLVVDENDNEIGVTFYVVVTQEVNNGYATADKKCRTLVSLGFDGSIISLYIVLGARTAQSFEDKVKDGLEINYGVDKAEDFANIEFGGLVAGASYTAQGVQKSVAKALEIMQANYGGNN